MTKRQVRQQINTTGYLLVLYILLLMIIRIGTAILNVRFPEKAEALNVPAISMVLMIAVYAVMGFLIFPTCEKRMGMRPRDYQRIPRLRIGRWAAMIFLGISICLIATTVSSIFQTIFETEMTDASYLGSFNSVTNIVNNLLYFFLYVIVKPISDEYIFRGLLQRQYGHYGRAFGIFASAMIYAFCQTRMTGAVPAFCLGWFISVMTVRYHSIEPGIRISIGANLVLWLLQVIPGKYIWLTTIMVVLIYAVTILCIVMKGVSVKLPPMGASGTAPWKILMTSSSTIICILLFIVNIIFTLVLAHI